jgi:AcrR family transcriptional regulator
MQIRPWWTIHHGPTLSMYYRDPRKQRRAADRHHDDAARAEFLRGIFAKNPIDTVRSRVFSRHRAGEQAELLRYGAEEASERSPRSAADRLESVEAAERLLASRGFEKTGMRELAAETGVSTATIYARFQSKRLLLAEIVERRLDEALQIAASFPFTDEAQPAPGHPLDVYLDTIRRLNRHFSADPLLRRIFAFESHVRDRRVLQHAMRVEQELTRRSAAALSRMAAEGWIRCEDPEAVAQLVSLSLQGWLARESRHGAPLSEERLTAALLESLRALALPGPARPRPTTRRR